MNTVRVRDIQRNKEKICVRCGEKFLTSTGGAKYCYECKDIIQDENKSRRSREVYLKNKSKE
jgi:tRNA(Ile2) C34 agmatinyltransferase TiaS